MRKYPTINRKFYYLFSLFTLLIFSLPLARGNEELGFDPNEIQEQQEEEDEEEEFGEQFWMHNLIYDVRSKTAYSHESQDVSVWTEVISYQPDLEIPVAVESFNSNFIYRLGDSEFQLGLDMFHEREENIMYLNSAFRYRYNFLRTNSGIAFGIMPEVNLPPRQDLTPNNISPGISFPLDVFLPSGLMFGLKTVFQKARDWDYMRWKTNYLTTVYVGQQLTGSLSAFLEFNDERSDEKHQDPWNDCSLTIGQNLLGSLQLQYGTSIQGITSSERVYEHSMGLLYIF